MKSLFPCLLAALLAAPLPLLAQDDAPPKPRPAHNDAAAAKPTEKAPEPLTNHLAGPYLAARTAAMVSDFREAATYYRRAYAQDPGSAYLADSTLVALVGAGDVPAALQVIAMMKQKGLNTDLAGLIQRADLARQSDWTGLMAVLDGTTTDTKPGDRLMDGMLRGWTLLGQGQANEAEAAFEALRAIEGAGLMIDYHLGLTKALVGDYEAAAKLLSDQVTRGHLMGLTALVQVLSHLDRQAEAAALIETTPWAESEPELQEMLTRLKAGETLPFTVVRDPRDGIAQVFLTFAGALADGVDPSPLGLIHARLAAYLAPDMPDTRLLSAQMLQSMGQFDLAEAEFAALAELGALRPVAEMSRIDALANADRLEDAEAAALALTQAQPDMIAAWVSLGDLRRQQEKFTESIPAYDKALDLIGNDSEARWFPLYARGIAYERSNQFDKAEADLKAAIAIRPDHASMLNYLGYSYVDRNMHLDQALDMIQRATELSPDDGYILDSLAWAYFRLGRYAEAVAPMERSAELMSNDSLVNDHLGDVYWMVGRKREAEIQWRRALSFSPEKPEDAYRIRAKLERGLDDVRAAEDANGGTLPADFLPVPSDDETPDDAADSTPPDAAEPPAQ